MREDHKLEANNLIGDWCEEDKPIMGPSKS